MANGDIKITVLVSGTLSDGTAIRSFSESKTIPNMADVFDRLVTVPTSEATVLQVNSTVAGDTIAVLSCIVVRNLDATNFVTIGIKDSTAKSVYFKLTAGDMFVLMDGNLECDDDTGAAWAAFNSIDIVTLQADTAACLCEVLAY